MILPIQYAPQADVIDVAWMKSVNIFTSEATRGQFGGRVADLSLAFGARDFAIRNIPWLTTVILPSGGQQ